MQNGPWHIWVNPPETRGITFRWNPKEKRWHFKSMIGRTICVVPMLHLLYENKVVEQDP